MKQITLVTTALLAITLMLTGGSLPALAVEPDEMLKDPKLEQRARDLSLNLRCLVCQNQSIDDSNAPLARDLRVLVRERLKKGDSNEQAVQYIVDRYGEFVLLKPRFGLHTLILWLGPFLLLAGGAFFGYRQIRSRSLAAETASAGGGDTAVKGLSEEEQQRLDALLKDS